MLRLCITLGMLVCGPLRAEPMQFRNDCMGNAFESCFIMLDGEITADTPAAFAAFLETTEGERVLLNSSGGALDAGLALGRIIRERGLRTEIGRGHFEDVTFDGETSEQFTDIDPGECVSACAYAFLGGRVRTVAPESRLGFHRVALASGGGLPGEGGLTAGQLVAAALITYLAEMDIDTRIFVEASGAASAAMHYPSPEELQDFGLVTPRGFAPFYIEPYRDGIIAVSKRRDSTALYDHVFQVTAFCRDGMPEILLTADIPALRPDIGETTFELDGSDFPIRGFAVRTDKDNSYVTVSPDRSLLGVLDRVETMLIGHFQSRAAGGFYHAELTLTRSDRDMLAAAFRFCI